jgi:hypothetical protein
MFVICGLPGCTALGIQYAMRMRYVRHLRPARLYSIFSHLINGMILKTVIEHTVCVLIFTITSV